MLSKSWGREASFPMPIILSLSAVGLARVKRSRDQAKKHSCANGFI